MERVICDSYSKREKRLWNLDMDNPMNKVFNQKVLAVNNAYGWLYEQGILEKIAFEFKDYEDIAYFAFSVNDLAPYHELLLASGLKDVDVAAEHIFNVEYTPCLYSGAIELGWTMRTYRDFDGTVESSWECDLVKHLNSHTVLEVEEIKNTQGVKAAVRATFDFSGFEPSNVYRVRALNEDDREQVVELDEMSGNDVAWGIDSSEYAWGIFAGRELIGYCTLGGTDDEMGYAKFNEWTFESFCLCDVFVKEEYRGRGVASCLISDVLNKSVVDGESVFLTILDDGLSCFYEKLGFKMLENGIMVREGFDLNNAKVLNSRLCVHPNFNQVSLEQKVAEASYRSELTDVNGVKSCDKSIEEL